MTAPLAVFAVAALLLGFFIVLQLRGSHPLVPPRLVRSRTMVAADLGMFLVGAGVFAMFFFLTCLCGTYCTVPRYVRGLATWQ